MSNIILESFDLISFISKFAENFSFLSLLIILSAVSIPTSAVKRSSSNSVREFSSIRLEENIFTILFVKSLNKILI